MQILSQGQVRDLLIRQQIFAGEYHLPDFAYAMPKRSWVEGAFSEALRVIQRELEARDWSSEENDCDDFARMAAALAGILHNRTPHREKCGIAFGEFWFQRDSRTGHAVNIFISEGPEIHFYEPQTQKLITLSERERGQCHFVRF